MYSKSLCVGRVARARRPGTSPADRLTPPEFLDIGPYREHSIPASPWGHSTSASHSGHSTSASHSGHSTYVPHGRWSVHSHFSRQPPRNAPTMCVGYPSPSFWTESEAYVAPRSPRRRPARGWSAGTRPRRPRGRGRRPEQNVRRSPRTSRTRRPSYSKTMEGHPQFSTTDRNRAAIVSGSLRYPTEISFPRSMLNVACPRLRRDSTTVDPVWI